MSISIIEKHQSLKKSSVSIKPYFDPRISNMGLEKYGMNLFDGVSHEEDLACLEQNGIVRYLTGLNEFAPEIKMIASPEEREAKIKQIRTVVSQLERELNSNVVEIDDEKFWDKIKLIHPSNHSFWSKIRIRPGNEPIMLDVNSDPYDLIKLFAIEAGGFSIIAKSFEDARSRAIAPKWYLDRLENTASIVTEVKKLKTKAGALLQSLFDKKQRQLFLVAKVIDINSIQYKKSTPNDIIYDNMYEYIEGNRTEKDKRKCAMKFIEIASLDIETVTLRALIKDGTFLRLMHTKPDGFIYHVSSNTTMGKTPSDAVEFLKNPLNEEILKTVQLEVEKYWNL